MTFPLNTNAIAPYSIIRLLAKTIGKPNAERTIPDVRKREISLHKFDVPEETPYDSLSLFAITVGIGAKR